MQLMTWPMGRLGSRFALLFEPARRRVLHSAVGRFLDRPLDLAVGLVEPGGAVGLAAILAGKVEARDCVSVAVLSGGNIDPALFGSIQEAG